MRAAQWVCGSSDRKDAAQQGESSVAGEGTPSMAVVAAQHVGTVVQCRNPQDAQHKNCIDDDSFCEVCDEISHSLSSILRYVGDSRGLTMFYIVPCFSSFRRNSSGIVLDPSARAYRK